MTGRVDPPRNKIDPSRIGRPIPLLAFLGVIVEGIVGIIAYAARDNPFFPLLALSLVFLPLVLVLIIYRLITRHHAKLYGPDQFPDPRDFMIILEPTTENIESIGKTKEIAVKGSGQAINL